MKKILVAFLVAVMGVGVATFPVAAAGACPDGCVETSILGENGCACDNGNGSGITDILNLVLDIMTYGVGALAILGMIIAGVQYLTARDNEAQMTKSKNRILQIVIGLAIYAVAYVVLRWLLPGFVAP